MRFERQCAAHLLALRIGEGGHRIEVGDIRHVVHHVFGGVGVRQIEQVPKRMHQQRGQAPHDQSFVGLVTPECRVEPFG